MKKTVSFYIIKETVSPFFIGLLIFTFIFLMSSILKLTELVVNKGVKLTDISKLILYAMPSFLIYTIPMALLMAIVTSLGRLSRDNEITAMKASGMSLYDLVPPIMFLSFTCFFFTSLMAIYAVPWGEHSYNKLIFNIVKTKVDIGIKERTFNTDFKGVVFYVNEIAVQGKKLKGILVSEETDMEEPRTIVAREGYVISDSKSLLITLRLIDGELHRSSKDFNTYQKITFSAYDINLDIGALTKDKAISVKEYKEMSISELQRKVRELREQGKNAYSPLRILHQKFSLPFACLVFGLLGIPMSIQSQPSGKFWGFVVSLGVLLIYYIFLTGGEVLAYNGKIPLAIGLWVPNFSLGGLGVYMLYKTANEVSFRDLLRIKHVLSQRKAKNGTL